MTAVSSTKVALRPQQEISAALPATRATPAARAHIPSLARSPVLVHYVVGEILVWHISPKPVSRELHGPLRRFADYSDKCLRTRPKTAKKTRTLTLRRCIRQRIGSSFIRWQSRQPVASFPVPSDHLCSWIEERVRWSAFPEYR